jgi:hypothetical protein
MAKTYIPKVPLYHSTNYADLAAFLLSVKESFSDYDYNYLVRQMANWLISDNPDFSRERFYQAAQYGGLNDIHQYH